MTLKKNPSFKHLQIVYLTPPDVAMIEARLSELERYRKKSVDSSQREQLESLIEINKKLIKVK